MVRPTAPEHLRTLAAVHPGRVEVIHRTAKGGLGPAYVAGFRRALKLAPDLIAQMDADLSHDPAVLPCLVAAIRDADLVVGSRYVPGEGLRAGHSGDGS